MKQTRAVTTLLVHLLPLLTASPPTTWKTGVISRMQEDTQRREEGQVKDLALTSQCLRLSEYRACALCPVFQGEDVTARGRPRHSPGTEESW